MKIEIHSPESPDRGYNIYGEQSNFPVRNMRQNLFIYDFDEDDIMNLLTQSQYKQFEAGKYAFNVTKKHLQLITGERSPQTRQELALYPQY